jgi:beta-galactosidase
VRYGEKNIIAVKLDTTENASVPPFGFVIDYLTYGGIYREVWFESKQISHIENIYLTTPDLTTLKVQVTAVNAENCTYQTEILEENGRVVLSQRNGATAAPFMLCYPEAKTWDLESPTRYICRVSLLSPEGEVLDVTEDKFGFRTAEFKANEFLLNGKPIFLRGLNRHQSYPYIGYAATESLQREDARILKEELGCVIVRTSHYPQSKHFIDECDRLGLLVFTEIPGWQHIGDENWREQAIENTKEMVLQYRNHPSIILWGVRINESQDDNDFYIRTNAAAHALDPSRATSGVRFIKQSALYEDVYGYNDFSHTGKNAGVEPKKAVTPDVTKALLITENNGHMFPTKSFDTWSRRQEHALRHARVQNDAAADGQHVGCISWCMFDYATHKDFGSGDRICYHGVLDSFRNPKPAAYLYAAQQEKEPVLFLTSSMDIGDYPAGTIGESVVFSNADEVNLYKNGDFVTTVHPGDYKGLPHPPLMLNDTVGCLLETKEGYPREKAEILRKCMNSIAKHGLAGMPKTDMAKMAYAMVKYKLNYQDAVNLYGKYVANWGGEATVWRLEAKKDGLVVAVRDICPSAKLHLEARASTKILIEGDTYDMAAIRVRILDENGNPAPYAQMSVKFSVEGPLELVGPDVVTAEGGMCGTYVKTNFQKGSAKLTISCHGLESVTVDFMVK